MANTFIPVNIVIKYEYGHTITIEKPYPDTYDSLCWAMFRAKVLPFLFPVYAIETRDGYVYVDLRKVAVIYKEDARG